MGLDQIMIIDDSEHLPARLVEEATAWLDEQWPA
jgi:hypothetical protein